MTAPARSKTTPDPIEPGRACRREMKLHVGVGLEPMFVFLVGVEVAGLRMMKLLARKGRGDVVHEVEKTRRRRRRFE